MKIRVVKNKTSLIASEIKTDKEYGSYFVTYYCYNDKCSARTEANPWPSTKGFKKGKKWFCSYCKEEMTGTYNSDIFA